MKVLLAAVINTAFVSSDLPRRGPLPPQWGDTAAPEPIPGQLLRGVFPGAGETDGQPAGRGWGGQLDLVLRAASYYSTICNIYLLHNQATSCCPIWFDLASEVQNLHVQKEPRPTSPLLTVSRLLTVRKMLIKNLRCKQSYLSAPLEWMDVLL